MCSESKIKAPKNVTPYFRRCSTPEEVMALNWKVSERPNFVKKQQNQDTWNRSVFFLWHTFKDTHAQLLLKIPPLETPPSSSSFSSAARPHLWAVLPPCFLKVMRIWSSEFAWCFHLKSPFPQNIMNFAWKLALGWSGIHTYGRNGSPGIKAERGRL